MTAKLVYTIISSPVGPLRLVASDAGLCAVEFGGGTGSRIEAEEDASNNILQQAKNQLDNYFAGKRKEFDVPLDVRSGTPFQRDAWRALRAIPYGETISYQEQAKRIGTPNACRAVGAANGKNPIAIIVPCHRVIGADGDLTGFGGGLNAKHMLLELEKQSSATKKAKAA